MILNCIDCGKVIGPTSMRCLCCANHQHLLGNKSKTGQRLSEETKAKISAAKTGKPNPHAGGIYASRRPRRKHSEEEKRRIWNDEFREKRRIANLGQRNPNWRGGASEERRLLKGTAAYVAWRKAVYERDDYTCQSCHQRGGNLHAHHILPYGLYPAKRLDVNNGTTLCVPCHRKTFRRLHHEDCAEIWSKGERPSQPQLELNADF